jgi:predicted phosphodiesterase
MRLHPRALGAARARDGAAAVRSRWPVRLGLVAICVVLATAGAALALQAAPSSVDRVALGTVSTEVRPAWRGQLDAYVPLVDWGVRVHPFHAPLAIRLEFRAVDRDAALAALRSGSATKANLQDLEQGLDRAVRAALRRSALFALLGATLGGLTGGALVGVCLYRRRWLATGAAVGLVTALAAIPLLGLGVARADWKSALDRPTFYARGSELPSLLGFSEQLLSAGASYTSSYDQAVASLSNLVALAGGGAFPTPATRTYLVASDLHLNRFALDAVERYASGSIAFQVGDFGLLGQGVEQDLAPSIAHLGTRTIAVSGNHDTLEFMEDLVRNGATVLTRAGLLRADGTTDGNPVIAVDNLLVAGYDDPLEGRGSLATHDLELDGDQLAEEQQRFVQWFRSLPERPNIVLVHEHSLAHALFDALQAEGGPPLTILTGHDHRMHVHSAHGIVIVDDGTVGAGGPLGVGVQRASFAQLRMDGSGQLRAVDLVTVEPLSGAASAERLVVQPDGQLAGSGPATAG